MDVFVHGLPHHTPDYEVQDFFGDILRSYGAPIIKCQRLQNKGCANLLIPDINVANDFLAAHGTAHDKPNVFRRSTLCLGNNMIYCKQGRNAPDPFEVKRLLRSGASEATSKTGSRDNSKGRFGFSIAQLAVGSWDYEGSRLIFHPCYRDARAGSLIIGTKQVLLKLESSTTQPVGVHVLINLWSIVSIVSNTVLSPSITLTLAEAPMMYSVRNQSQDVLLECMLNLSLDIRATRPQGPQYDRICYLSKLHQPTVGTCFVYQITLGSVNDLLAVEARLRNTYSAPQSVRSSFVVAPILRDIKADFDYLNHEFTVGSLLSLPFSIKFQCQRLAFNGFLSPGKVLDLVPRVSDLVHEFGEIAVAESIRNTSRSIPYAGPHTKAQKLSCNEIVSSIASKAAAFTFRGSMYHSAKTHEHLGLVHKVIITPACTRLEGPDLEHMNRVLRKYSRHVDHFLRVSFCDEDGEQLKYEVNVSRSPVFERFKNVLLGEDTRETLRICGRIYSFIGYSHSSLRSQQCWLMAPFYEDKLVYAQDVIKGLGDFSNIQIPAKCAARIGQCFSESTETIIPSSIAAMHDIERNGRNFSDGIGTISYDQLRLIWRQFSRAKKNHATCIQIRYQGAKGMLVLDRSLTGEQIKFRESMMKFPGSRDKDLEILNASYKPLQMYLNRQFICIMEQLGSRPESFLALQRRALSELEKMIESPTRAAKYLDSNHYGTACRLPFLIRTLCYIGLDYHDDEFLHQAVEAATRVELRELKHRARIPVEDAHTLIGVVDETGFLKEGQIHVIVKQVNGEVVQRTGGALITRAPALHPGDFQFVQAIAPPADSTNQYLHNCVIFSQHGERDLPSMLSGGDLDGDLYNVIFDKTLFPESICTPADYPRVTAKGLGRTVTAADMADFFIDFMAQDKLGHICITHLIIADQKDEGVYSPECLKLASMASVAVDFSKTGIAVDMAEFPAKNTYNNRLRPDFMAPVPRLVLERNMQINTIDDMDDDPEPDAIAIELDSRPSRYRYYESQKVLGQLYRAIDETKFLNAINAHGPQASTVDHRKPSLMQTLWIHIQHVTRLFEWQDYCPFARRVRDKYDEELVNLMYDYCPHPQSALSELEVFLGIILGKDGGLPSRRVREKNVNLKEQSERHVRNIVGWIRRGDADEHDETGDIEDMYEEHAESTIGSLDGHGASRVLSGALERSIACVAVARDEEGYYYPQGLGLMKSFKYVAAAVCLGELENLQGPQLTAK